MIAFAMQLRLACAGCMMLDVYSESRRYEAWWNEHTNIFQRVNSARAAHGYTKHWSELLPPDRLLHLALTMRAAQRRIATPDRLTKYWIATDAHDQPCLLGHARAWDLFGAVWTQCSDPIVTQCAMEATGEASGFESYWHQGNLGWWTDRPECTHAHVMLALARAICRVATRISRMSR